MYQFLPELINKIILFWNESKQFLEITHLTQAEIKKFYPKRIHFFFIKINKEAEVLERYSAKTKNKELLFWLKTFQL